MEKYSEILGLPVIEAETGKNMGNVKDLVFSHDTREVRGFILEPKGFKFTGGVVLLEDVLSLGKDALIINRGTDVKEHEKAKGNGDVIGLKVYTRSGENLGVVKDYVFDSGSGNIESVEVSDGLLQDIMEGRKILPLFGKVEFSEEIILIDREAVEESGSTGGGLNNLLN